MGVSLSTARWLAPALFLYDFAAQQYGIYSSPSMKEIHDRNLSFFSPQPYFIAAFFFPQQLCQLAWLYKIYKSDPNATSTSPGQKRETEEMIKYVPYYALGNLCIGTWMFFWNAEQLILADLFVIVNTAAQLFYISTQLPPMNTRSKTSILTHIVAKTFAGIGVLDILHNTSVAFFKDQYPSLPIKVLTGAAFAGMGMMSDWIFGGCLVYDLVALCVGQRIYFSDSNWGGMLGLYALATAAIVGIKNWFRPPYTKGEEGYGALGQDED